MESVTTELMERSITASITTDPDHGRICDDIPVTLIASGGSTFFWSDGSTDAELIVSEPGDYSVTVSEGNCQAETTINIIRRTPIVDPGFNDIIECDSEIPDGLTLDAGNLGNALWEWSTGSRGQMLSITENGEYSVRIYNECFELTTEPIIIEYKGTCDPGFINAFTPDGDGVNDHYEFIEDTNCNYDFFQYSIFNRWGDKVFEGSDITATWDGNINGKPAPSDVYVIAYKYKLNSCEINESTEVLLIR